MDKKTGIAIGSALGIIGVLLCFFATLSFFINQNNKEKLNKDVYVVIYQYEVVDFNINPNSTPIEVYRALFTEELVYEQVINNNQGGSNTVYIKDGVIKVTHSNCRDHICENYIIKKENLLNNTDITCMPNGLIITLEVVK